MLPPPLTSPCLQSLHPVGYTHGSACLSAGSLPLASQSQKEGTNLHKESLLPMFVRYINSFAYCFSTKAYMYNSFADMERKISLWVHFYR